MLKKLLFSHNVLYEENALHHAKGNGKQQILRLDLTQKTSSFHLIP